MFRPFFPFSKLRFDFRFLLRCVSRYSAITVFSSGALSRLVRGERMAAPLRDHRIISRRRFLSEAWPSRVSFFLVRAGSFLDSARRQSGVLVKFLHPPRSFLIGKNAAATSQPSLLVAGLWPQLCRDVIRGVQTRVAACPRRVDIYLRSASAEAVQSLINFLFGGNAATRPRLFCLRFFVGASPRRFSLIPNFFLFYPVTFLRREIRWRSRKLPGWPPAAVLIP